MTAAPFRRLLVALDASPPSLAALDAAADLAARADGELAGLYVEDVDVLRLAGLATAQVVDAVSSAARPTDSAEMERTLHGLAARARQALAQAAVREGVRWSFRVARGRVAAEIVAAAAEADLVCLGCASWSGGRGVRLGATASGVAERAPRSVLLVRGGDAPPTLPVVVYDGRAPACDALAAAVSLARGAGGRVVVLLPSGDDAGRERLRAEAAHLLEGAAVAVEFRSVGDVSPERLVRAAAADAGAVLVVAAESPDRTSRLLSLLRQSVLIVR